MAAKLALGVVVGSALFLMTKGASGALLLLIPGAVRQGYVWQLFSYAFIEGDPIGILFGAFIVWSIGSWLEGVWGPRKLLVLGLGGTVLAGVLTVLVSFILPVGGMVFFGGTVLSSILWVAYGLVIGRGQANFWGLPLSGYMLAAIGAGFVLLRAFQVGWAAQLPDLFGLLIAFGYVKGRSPRGLWLHFQHWRLQRQLRSRSRNLRVVSSDRPNDRFLN